MFDLSRKPIPHYNISSSAETRQKWHEERKIIAFVRVSHYYVFSVRCFHSAHNGTAVSALFYFDYPCSRGACNIFGVVGASVVSDYYFPVDILFFQKLFRFLDANTNRPLLVETGHEYCK